MDSSSDDMLLEIRRHTLAMDEASNVNMMRDAMRLMVTGIEMANNRIGLLDLEGWSSDVCRDLKERRIAVQLLHQKLVLASLLPILLIVVPLLLPGPGKRQGAEANRPEAYGAKPHLEGFWVRRAGAGARLPERQHIEAAKPGFQGQGQIEGRDDGADDGAADHTEEERGPEGTESEARGSEPENDNASGCGDRIPAPLHGRYVLRY